MHHVLPKAYDAKTTDSKWYQFWKDKNLFQADPSSDKTPYCIVIPPPNVTGVLHMGHALVNTLQDILIRWKRMQGFEVLWVPGTDHAGIATQAVVERDLMEKTRKKRNQFEREEFLSHVWAWKEKSEQRILDQLKRLGSSCDWSRCRFTMDDANNKSVKKMFKKLYDDGLIYRGDYLVNWDPLTQTALADDEVEYEERNSFLWHIRYPLEDGSKTLVVATTRPETMLGDTAVAISPKDARYFGLAGKRIKLPLTDRLIPIIEDHHVDPLFGTGVVKVTPAHDPNDYQMGITHSLAMINIMTPDGKINEQGGIFAGLSMAEARKEVVKALSEAGFIEKIEPHTNRVGLSYRSKAVIEPYLSKQWFVKMSGFKEKLKEAVVNKKTRLVPQHWESTYFHWIDHLRDWCISRQIWWGHRIPVWYNKQDPEKMICFDGEDLPEEVKKAPDDWVQDKDVLDTWFSSALWPFATLGWPEKTADLKKFYPNATLVTGHDILFFWVARMMAMGEYATGELPFPETFLHGLIYGKSYWRNREEGGIAYVSEEERLSYDLGKPVPKDVFSKWEKMSKSKGNVINPLEMIDQYGTDAVRMALAASATQARQIDLDRRRFEEFKNFSNKVWNGARFVIMNLEGLTLDEGIKQETLKLEDRWILATLDSTIKAVNSHLEKYEFDQASLKAYNFFWDQFCAYYVEIVKPVLFEKAGSKEEKQNKQKVLLVVLCQAIRLLHPMTPFITEELFQLLKELVCPLAEGKNIKEPYIEECLKALNEVAIATAPFPVSNQTSCCEKAEKEFAVMEEVAYTIRNIRGEMKLPPGLATDIYFVADPKNKEFQLIQDNQLIVSALIRTNTIHFLKEEPSIGFSSTGSFSGIKIMLPMPEELLRQEAGRLVKEQEKLHSSLDKLKQQLENHEFVEKAPKELVAKLQAQKANLEAELKVIAEKQHLLKQA